MRRVRRALLLTAAIAAATPFALPGQPAAALPGACGEGHVGGEPVPLDQCTVDECAGVGAGPMIAEPYFNVFVCLEF